MGIINTIPRFGGIFGRHLLKSGTRYAPAISPIAGILLLTVAALAGCAGIQPTNRRPPENTAASSGPIIDVDSQKISALESDISALNPQADRQEARRVAETAVVYARDLAEAYDLVRPPVLHNVMVRMGLKDRGLCYHWTEDMIKRLQSLGLKTYRLHWGVAHRGSELREHNSVVITAASQAFENGLVLDPWRNSGDLYWARVKADEYPWEERPPHEW